MSHICSIGSSNAIVPPIDVSPSDLETLRVILRRHVHDREFRVIGSRVTGRAKPFSDLDLIIMGDVALPLRVRGELRDDLDESNLPFTVDLVEWATASDDFRRVIVREARPLLPPA